MGSGEVAAGVGGVRVGEPPEAHLGAVCVLVWGRAAGGEGARRRRPRRRKNPAKLGQQPVGKWRAELARGLAGGLGCPRGRRVREGAIHRRWRQWCRRADTVSRSQARTHGRSGELK
jgi:predicted alpha/beta hydrolase